MNKTKKALYCTTVLAVAILATVVIGLIGDSGINDTVAILLTVFCCALAGIIILSIDDLL